MNWQYCGSFLLRLQYGSPADICLPISEERGTNNQNSRLQVSHPKATSFKSVLYCIRSSFQLLVFVVAVVSSLLALVQPAFNAFALMTLGVPTLVLLISELSRYVNTLFSDFICAVTSNEQN